MIIEEVKRVGHVRDSGTANVATKRTPRVDRSQSEKTFRCSECGYSNDSKRKVQIHQILNHAGDSNAKS